MRWFFVTLILLSGVVLTSLARPAALERSYGEEANGKRYVQSGACAAWVSRSGQLRSLGGRGALMACSAPVRQVVHAVSRRLPRQFVSNEQFSSPPSGTPTHVSLPSQGMCYAVTIVRNVASTHVVVADITLDGYF